MDESDMMMYSKGYSTVENKIFTKFFELSISLKDIYVLINN